MNERIRELFKQAGGRATVRNLTSNPVQTVETLELWGENIDKFVELIVQECIEQCESNSPEVDRYSDEHVLGEHFAVKECVHSIKTHFGIDG